MSKSIKKYLAVAALALSTMLAATAGQAHAVTTTEVPFRAHFSGVITPPQGPPPVALNGAGLATYLGRITSAGGAAIIGQAARCPNSGWFIRQDHVLTSVDGTDQISLTIHDQSCLSAPSTIHGQGTYVVTGGSGRFVGASGHGTFDGYGDFAAGTFVITLDGTISRPSRALSNTF